MHTVYTWKELLNSNKSKGDLFRHLSEKGKIFDYALPQNWLDNMSKHPNLTYDMVLYSTVWIYPEDEPYSVCKDVCRVIEELKVK